MLSMQHALFIYVKITTCKLNIERLQIVTMYCLNLNTSTSFGHLKILRQINTETNQ